MAMDPKMARLSRRADQAAVDRSGFFNALHYRRWIEAERSREIHKFYHVQPPFAELDPRHKLLVEPEPLRQLLLRYAEPSALSCQLLDYRTVAGVTKARSCCPPFNHCKRFFGQFPSVTETVTWDSFARQHGATRRDTD